MAYSVMYLKKTQNKKLNLFLRGIGKAHNVLEFGT